MLQELSLGLHLGIPRAVGNALDKYDDDVLVAALDAQRLHTGYADVFSDHAVDQRLVSESVVHDMRPYKLRKYRQNLKPVLGALGCGTQSWRGVSVTFPTTSPSTTVSAFFEARRVLNSWNFPTA